jgi:Ca-activated chloride channel family protein
VLGLALLALILAAAKPEHAISVPVTGGAVMLATDVSSSMASTDVHPSRLRAAARAGALFTRSLPPAMQVGLEKFDKQPAVLQSPSTDHALVLRALRTFRVGGHTAIGTAVNAATEILSRLRTPAGKRVPSAIVLISDGGSDLGANPYAAAARAKREHIPVFTVVVGTPHGTITVPAGRQHARVVPVPVAPAELETIARDSGGRSFTAGDAGHLSAVYAHLAAQLGHQHVKRQITSTFAGAGLVLLLAGGGLSLRWFGRFA